MSSPSYSTLFDFAPRHANFRTRSHASAILAFQQHHRAAAVAAAGLTATHSSSSSSSLPSSRPISSCPISRKRRTIKDEITCFIERHALGPPHYPAYLKNTLYAFMVQEQYTLYSTQQLSTDTLIPQDSITAALISHDLRLPTAWNPEDKGEYVDMSEDCLELTYQGAGKEDADISAVRANYPFRPQCGIFYYEVEIISKGLDGHIGIGFCWSSNSLDRLPGWEEHSWGYHGDDGHLFSGPGTSQPYGPKFGTGDIIGCGFDFRTMSSFYTKNGVYLGIAFENVTGRSIFPFVGFKTPGEKLRANFGQHDFKFDMMHYFKEEQQNTLNHILFHPSPSRYTKQNNVGSSNMNNKKRKEKHRSQLQPQKIHFPSSKSASQYHQQKQLQDQVVLDYLLHHGYTQSATLLRRSIQHDGTTMDAVDQEQDPKYIDAQSRSDIRTAIMQGNVEEAITLCHDKYPQLLEKNLELLFRLRCRRFIDLVYKAQQQQQNTSDPMEVDNNNTSLTNISSPPLRQHAGTKRRRPSHNEHSPIVPDQDDSMQDHPLQHNNPVEEGEYVDGFENEMFREIMIYGQQLQQEYSAWVEQRPAMKAELMVRQWET
ncbi:hypothetical protein BDA99DRAFT_230887 [Phascolomyces articulosus]|uniref:Protein SSH4 n=1 Tax=Phascolomyces articulosus TaxID=60185 RepID=A0AAD5P8I9_9FUNG|nr:hypothetical protein BDA99DRAFT_230887 [Phascolomyces articulosus]